uniref:Phosphatidylinositol transfer protein membrane associated 2 n=1 Tax=Rhinopithecus bieti TaxID=61621 RepID=A0A2K6N6G1_RHIBE
MIIKEYRIPLPMTVEEYRIAQLYMIQKKSRNETYGEGSGVEILENRPYTDGPGGSGQYTHKVYHVGMHIPSWFRSILPKAALRVVEESWNAYPYARTRFTCPFVEKFSIDIETFYKTDAGENPDVFNLSPVEKNQLTIGNQEGQSPTGLYSGFPTHRPLLSCPFSPHLEYKKQVFPIMCAYKLCKVEFRYWGMQSKIERFIHDTGEHTPFRVGSGRAAQPLCLLSPKQRRGQGLDGCDDVTTSIPRAKPSDTLSTILFPEGLPQCQSAAGRGARPPHCSQSHLSFPLSSPEDLSDTEEMFPKDITKWSSNDLMDKIESPEPEDTQDGLYRQSSPEFRVASSVEQLNIIEDEVSQPLAAPPSKIHVLLLVLHGGTILDTGAGDPSSKKGDANTIANVFDTVMRVHYPSALGRLAIRLVPCPPVCSDAFALVSNLSPYSHDEGCLSSSQDHIPLAALPLLATSSPQYQEAVATVIQRANLAYGDFIKSQEGMTFNGQVCLIGDCVGGILAFDALCYSNQPVSESQSSSRRGSVVSMQDNDMLSPGILVNAAHSHCSGGGNSGGGGSSGGSSLESSRHLSRSNVDIPRSNGPEDPKRQLPRKRSDSSTYELDTIQQHQAFLSSLHASVLRTEPCSRHSSSSTMLDGTGALGRFDFEITDLFLFGCPLGLVLALRKTVIPALDVFQLRPACQQVYNLFHPADPSASRLEPLLERRFHALPPFSVPRYQRYPLGDGCSTLLADVLQTHNVAFQEHATPSSPSTAPASRGFRRASEISIASQVSGMAESYTASSIAPMRSAIPQRQASVPARPAPPHPITPGPHPPARQVSPSLERAPGLPELDIREGTTPHAFPSLGGHSAAEHPSPPGSAHLDPCFRLVGCPRCEEGSTLALGVRNCNPTSVQPFPVLRPRGKTGDQEWPREGSDGVATGQRVTRVSKGPGTAGTIPQIPTGPPMQPREPLSRAGTHHWPGSVCFCLHSLPLASLPQPGRRFTLAIAGGGSGLG